MVQVRNAGGGDNFQNWAEVRKVMDISWAWKDVMQRSVWMAFFAVMGGYGVYMASEPKFNFRYSKLK